MISRRRRLLLPVIGLSSALLLSGCLSLLPAAQNAPSIYRMDINGGSAAIDKPLNAPIIILPKPIATRALSGDEIVLSPDGRRIAYASRARWVEPVPSLVQNAFLDGFSQSGSIVALPTGTAVRGDYTLQIQVHNFEAVFEDGEELAPTAHIRLTLTLTDNEDRTLTGQKEITVRQIVASRGVSDITLAQTGITRDAVKQALTWAEGYTARSRG